MSLKLSNSNNIGCKINPKYSGKGFFENSISMGEYTIHICNFIEIVKYFMENTDLEINDVRWGLIEYFNELRVSKGYNEGNERFSL